MEPVFSPLFSRTIAAFSNQGKKPNHHKKVAVLAHDVGFALVTGSEAVRNIGPEHWKEFRRWRGYWLWMSMLSGSRSCSRHNHGRGGKFVCFFSSRTTCQFRN